MSKQGLLSCFGIADVEDPNGDPMTTSTQIENRNQNKKQYTCCVWIVGTIAVILLLFPVVTIPILFTLYAKVSNSSQTYQTTYQSATFPSAVLSASTPLTAGTPVSLSSTGAVQIGGGTSIYRNIGAIPADSCPKYLSAAPIFDDKFLVSYTDTATQSASVSVMQVNSTRKTAVLSYNQSATDLYHIVTLNQATGLFVSVTQDDNTNAYPAVLTMDGFLVAGRSNKNNGYAISFGAAVTYSTGNLTVDPSICVLSNTTFAIAYFDGNSDVNVRIGSVNPITLAITISVSQRIVLNPNYAINIAVTALSATQFMVLYFDSSLSYALKPAPLSAIIVNASFSAHGVNYAKPTYSAPQTYVGSSLGLDTFKATTLDSGDVIACYGDQQNNNGITCTHIVVQSGGTIRFGSNLVISTGQTIATDYSITGITVATIGGGVQFMVMFVDVLLNGAIITAIGELSGSILVRTSPNYLLSHGVVTTATLDIYVSMAVSKRTLHGSHVAILSAVTDKNCVLKPITDFSYMEVMARPFGVMASSVASTDAYQYGSVAVSGMASGFTGLTPGLNYYTTTSGKVITDGVYYGRDSSNPASNGYYYVTDVVDKVIVSAESHLGVAVSSTTILLR